MCWNCSIKEAFIGQDDSTSGDPTAISYICLTDLKPSEFQTKLLWSRRDIFTNSASLCSPSVKHDITCRSSKVTRRDRVVQTSPLFTFNKTNTFRLLKNVLWKLRWPIQVIINSLRKCNIWFAYLETAWLQCGYLLCGSYCISLLSCVAAQSSHARIPKS